jgi:hypothetical protein
MSANFMLRNTLVLTAVLGLAETSRSAVSISQSIVPTVGVAGYHTYRLTASTDDGSQIQGFDFASQPSFGFFGPMKQINPAGNLTVFDIRAAACSFFLPDICQRLGDQDSFFLFDSASVTKPAGFDSESAMSLRSVFANSTPWGTSVPFVQLVIPDSAEVRYTGQIQTVSAGGPPRDNNVSGFLFIPEPSMLGLIGVAMASGLGFGRRRINAPTARKNR